jgi:hypothetical protein
MRFGGARVQMFSDSLARVSASQPWLLVPVEPDFYLVSQTREWASTKD